MFRLYQCVLLGFLFASQSVFAQVSFSPQTNFPTGNEPLSVAAGDLNGDGKPDLVVVNQSSNTVSVFLNTTPPGATTPSFSAKTDFATGANPYAVAIGDLNGDGKSDIVVANHNSNTVSVFLNTTAPGSTTPTFAARTDFATGAWPDGVSIGDLNGDGLPDLVVTNNNSNTVSVFLNTTTPGATTPSFSAKTDFSTGTSPVGVSIGDLNGDGMPDIVVTNSGSTFISVFMNTTAPGATTPSFSTQTDFAIGGEQLGVSINDLNGDGKPDLAVVNYTMNTVSVFLNTTAPGASTPSFSAKTDFATGIGPYFLSVADLNGDGLPDLAVPNSQAGTISVLLNTTVPGATTPTFSAKTDFPVMTGPLVVSISDFNGDGEPDLVAVNVGSNTVSVLLNTTVMGVPTPSFSAKTDFPTGAYPYFVSVGDLNGDGKPDLAVVDANANTISVLLNTTAPGATTPTFSAKTDFATGTSPRIVAIRDINGDGRQDLVVVNTNSNTFSVFLNTTAPGAMTPTFSARTDFPAGSSPSYVYICDLNGDGLSDLAVVNYTFNTVSVFLNTTAPGATTPTLSAMTVFTTEPGSNSVSIRDINGDGKPDMIVTNFGSNTLSVFLNTTSPGATTPMFSANTDFATGTSPVIVSIADFNGDGMPDLAVGNFGSNSVSVFLNTTVPGATTPTFSAKTDFATGNTPFSISIGDFNGDGKPDLVVANDLSNTVSVMLNMTTPGATTPSFSVKTDFTAGSYPNSVAIGDFNGDGKPDLVLANGEDNTVSIFLNAAVLPLPVELTSFSVTAGLNTVELAWKTATEVNNAGFEIQRTVFSNQSIVNSKTGQGSTMNNWTKVGFVAGHGTTNAPQQYACADNVGNAGTYSYRLKQIDHDGAFTYSQAVQVTVAVPKVLALSQNFPEPFNPSTTIQFTVPSDGKATIKVYNAIGQEVATLFNDEAATGVVHQVQFNGSNLASGIYFSRLEFGGKMQVKKMLLLK